MSSIKPFFKCFYVKKTDRAEAGGDECLRGVWTCVGGGKGHGKGRVARDPCVASCGGVQGPSPWPEVVHLPCMAGLSGHRVTSAVSIPHPPLVAAAAEVEQSPPG